MPKQKSDDNPIYLDVIRFVVDCKKKGQLTTYDIIKSGLKLDDSTFLDRKKVLLKLHWVKDCKKTNTKYLTVNYSGILGYIYTKKRFKGYFDFLIKKIPELKPIKIYVSDELNEEFEKYFATNLTDDIKTMPELLDNLILSYAKQIDNGIVTECNRYKNILVAKEFKINFKKNKRAFLRKAKKLCDKSRIPEVKAFIFVWFCYVHFCQLNHLTYGTYLQCFS